MSDFQRGYEDAIEALKDLLNGQNNNSNNTAGAGNNSVDGGENSKVNNVDSKGNKMQNPELNSKDQQKANKNAKNNINNQNGSTVKGKGNGSINNQTKREVEDCNSSQGSIISQDAAIDIAKAEGYEGDYLDKQNDNNLAKDWEEAAMKAAEKTTDNGRGIGNLITKLSTLYKTNYDWKNELRRYIGKALNNLEVDYRIGKKKWLANDVFKKYDKPKENALSSVVFMIDCSGSVFGNKELTNKLLGECIYIIKSKGIKSVTYCYYDDGIRAVESTEQIKSPDNAAYEIVQRIPKSSKGRSAGNAYGGGGNYEVKVMKDWLDLQKKNNIRQTQLMIWFTDGHCNNIPDKPRQEIKHMIWCIYENKNFKSKDGTKVIHMPNDYIKI